jgi:hypothetical protein
MSSDAPKPSLLDQGQHASWWVWTSWIEAPSKPAAFVYGIAARCQRPAAGARKTLMVERPAWSLVRTEAILSDAEFARLIDAAPRGTITFDASMVVGAPTLAIVATRNFIGDCLGHGAAAVTSHATCTTPPALANDIEGWISVLKALEAELGLSFSAEDADRIGCFDVVTLQAWLEETTPVLLEAIMPETETRRTAGVRRLHICRARDFATARQFAHLTCFAEERRIIDRLVMLGAGQQRSAPIEAPHAIERFELSVFSESGDLLHRETASFFGGFKLTMGILGRRVQLDDDLARRAGSHGRRDAASSHQVTSVTHENSSTTFASLNEQWVRHKTLMSDLRRRCFPAKGHDKWFRRSLDDELGVIAHFNTLLNGGAIRAAVLVDPFFGADALARFALRLSSTDVAVTVVTSWTATDPDTGHRLADRASAVAQLEALLRNASQFLNPHLSVVNLANGTDQAFHDRYLLLYPRQGDPQVYLLSNSVNAMAANWPFCMSLLADDVRQQAQAYIEGLCRGADITGSTNPAITFRWPIDA